MFKIQDLLKLGVLFIAIFAGSTVADAQATRTWVSGVGDDVNPCSRTAPCKTFAGAISKTATGGEISCMDAGGFGAVTITKSISIDCKQAVGGVLASLTNGIVISNAAAVVRIRGININGAGNGLSGIRIVAAARVNIEESAIDGFTQHGVSVENSGAIQVVVDRMTIRNCTLNAINVAAAGTADVTISNSTLSGNGVGISTGANGMARVAASTIVYNGTGISTAGTGKIVSFGNNVIDGNVKNGTATTKGALM